MPEGRLQMSDNTPETIRLREMYERERAIADRLQAQLDAKDTEIAARDVTISVLQGNFEAYAREVERLRAQIAERDATIAKNEAFFKEWASGEDKFQQFGGWERIERLQHDHKAMWEALTEILGNSDDEGAKDYALECLQSLKEPNT